MLTYFLFKAVKTDLDCLMIPDEASLGLCILAVGSGGFSIMQVDLALFILIAASFVMGMGDAKLLAALTLLFGSEIFYVIGGAFMICFVYCAIGLAGRHLRLSDEIPFAPFIALPACALWYNTVLEYIGL